MKTCMKDERKERETKDETEQGQIWEALHSGSHQSGKKQDCYNLEYVKNQESQREDGKADLDSNVSKEGLGSC